MKHVHDAISALDARINASYYVISASFILPGGVFIDVKIIEPSQVSQFTADPNWVSVPKVHRLSDAIDDSHIMMVMVNDGNQSSFVFHKLDRPYATYPEMVIEILQSMCKGMRLTLDFKMELPEVAETRYIDLGEDPANLDYDDQDQGHS